MNKKFELSLWRDYHSAKEVDLYNNANPGKGLEMIMNPDELEIGQCYYVWDRDTTENEEKAQEDNQSLRNKWIYPLLLTSIKSGYSANESDRTYYHYYFITENGEDESVNSFLQMDTRYSRFAKPVDYLKEEKIKILANNNLEQFQGKIYNIHFISKIDGTHTLTFEAPQFYMDIYTGKKTKNDYLDLIHLKSKLKLYYKDNWYTFVVNVKQEEKTRGYIKYNFEATDLAIEELSKNGYSLNFTEDEETIDLCGMGNIKELTERVVLNTDWYYDEKLTTANLQETKKIIKLNPQTNMYEDFKEPTMVYKSHYSPCLKKYVYETNFGYKIEQDIYGVNKGYDFLELTSSKNNITDKIEDNVLPIYFTTEDDVSCSGSVKNIIASNSNFVNPTKDWIGSINIKDYIDDNGNKNFGMRIIGDVETSNFVDRIISNKPYVIRVISDNLDSTYDISLNNINTSIFKANKLSVNKYYYIYPNKSISNPTFRIHSNNSLFIKKIELFELDLRNQNDEEINITRANLNIDNYISPNSFGELNIVQENNSFTIINGKLKVKDRDNYILIPDIAVTATTKQNKLYFVEPYTKIEQVQKAFEDYTISELKRDYLLELSEKDILDTQFSNLNDNIIKEYDYTNYVVFTADTITITAKDNLGKYIVYTDQWGEKYYYSVEKIKYKDIDYYLWRNIMLPYSDQKRRLVTVSHSSRWNIIQDIAEKFEVFPKFQILCNPETGEWIYKNGKPIKKIYYVDRVGKLNYAGFKDGINLSDTKRKIISDEIVTKLYVDNIEADYANEGVLSIQLSEKNSTKENYIYNFRHYLNTGALSKKFLQQLEQHEGWLKNINRIYLKVSNDLVTLSESVSKAQSFKDGLIANLDSSRAEIEKNKIDYLQTCDYCTYISSKFLKTFEEIEKGYLGQGKIMSWVSTQDGETDIQRSTVYNNDHLYGAVIFDHDYKPRNETQSYTVFAPIWDVFYDADGWKRYNNEAQFNQPLRGSVVGNATWKQLYDYCLTKFKPSEFIQSRYLTIEQKEFIFEKGKIPFEDDTTYCKKVGSKYQIISLEEAKKLKNSQIYIYECTRHNMNWEYYSPGGVYVGWNIDSQGRRFARYFRDILYIENKKTNYWDGFWDYLVNSTHYTDSSHTDERYYWTNTWEGIDDFGLYPVLKECNTSELNSRIKKIELLINGENNIGGEKDLIPMVYEAKKIYYEELAKYEAAKLLSAQLLQEKQNLIINFETKYAQYIKEGHWSENTYSNNDTYYLDALNISADASIPKVEYVLSVIDLSPIEYYQDYSFEVGDETFATDKDLFGYNKDGTLKLEKVIVTELNEQLDNTKNNNFTVRNFKNRFEDLFQRLSASTVQVETNEYTWSRAAALNPDGTIPSSLLTSINAKNSEWVSNSIGLLNTYSLDEQGLDLISQLDNNYQLKATAFGIFLTTSALQNTEWTAAITAEGINASCINTGRLNTNKITIFSDYAPAQTWNELGISCYKDTGTQDKNVIDETNLVRLDQFGLYLVQNSGAFGLNNGIPWFVNSSYESSVELIRDKSKVSITQLGFKYNSNPGSISGISIGQIDKNVLNTQEDNLEGIHFTNEDNQVIFHIDNKNNAKIAGFMFDNDKMWKYSENNGAYGNLEPSLNSTYYGKINSNDYPFYIGSQGLAMKGIKLDAISGTGWFNDIRLIGGDITGNVKIKQALIGPFKFHAPEKDGYYHDPDPNSTRKIWDPLSYMYAYRRNDGNWFDIPEQGGLLPLYNNAVALNGQSNSSYNPNNPRLFNNNTNRAALLKRSNKFYLGEFLLTQNIIEQCGWTKSFAEKLTQDENGILLSIGDAFWMHTCGKGMMSGDIYIKGTIHADKISADRLDVENLNGVNISEILAELNNHGEEVTQIINNYLAGGQGRSIYASDNQNYVGLTNVKLNCFSKKHGDFIIKGPALYLGSNLYDYYIVHNDGLLLLAMKAKASIKYNVKDIAHNLGDWW